MKKLSLKKLRAFSLIELSVVILVIGILVSGVVGGSKLISRFRLQSAQTLTLSSPVVTTKGLVLWLESSMPESFLSTEMEDGSQLTKWIDRNPQATTKFSANTTASAGITFKAKSNIYDLPAVYFNGSSAAVFTLSNGFANVFIRTPNNAYTFFIVAKLDDDSASTVKTIFSNGSATGWGYGVSGSQNIRSRNLIFSGATDITSTTANATTRPEIISAIYTGGTDGSVQLFTNGVGNAGTGEAGTAEFLSASKITSGAPSTSFYIGNKSANAPWTGDIYEIIIFNRVLSTKERNQIELYLGQKYNIKVAETGNVTGCPVNLAGVLTTHVAEGSSSLSCLAAGYSGSVPYSCSGNILTTTGVCGATTCTISGETGMTNGTTVNYGTTSTTCNAAGYTGSVTYYSCAGGAASVTGNTCVPITCTITGQAGMTNGTTVNYGTTSTTCNAAGYAGSIVYDVCTSGAANVTSNNCAVFSNLVCTGGDTVSSVLVAGRKVHIFKNSGTFECSAGTTTNDLIYLGVGPGGPGGDGKGMGSSRKAGGGGGGGQVRYVTGATLQSGYSITVTIASHPNSTSISGSISEVFGAGGFGGRYSSGGQGYSGGNGQGGAVGTSGGGSGGGGAGGNAGGSGGVSNDTGASNGSAGDGNTDIYVANGGNGGGQNNGVGVSYDITGTSVLYGKGGNGGIAMNTNASASGGGANTGGGGGGGGASAGGTGVTSGLMGASGVVVFSYPYQ